MAGSLPDECRLLLAGTLRNLVAKLKPSTGLLVFRDYAFGDLAQVRLHQSRGARRISDCFYSRQGSKGGA